MPTRYIVGYDGSPAAEAALAFAEMLAGVTEADVTAATVHHPGEESRAEAERTVTGVGGAGVRRLTVEASSSAEGLHLLAEGEEAELLVVGVTHRGALGRVVPGSVAERLLHGAPCPVAVVPEGPLDRIRVVAVAYDGRPESDQALETAERLAGLLGARVTRVEVPHGTAGVGNQLIDDALERTAGLLVAGSRGYGPLRAVLVGSVSRHLCDHPPCPVLIVPRGARTTLAEPVVVA